MTETVAGIDMARSVGWGAMVSHRSGKPIDSYILSCLRSCAFRSER